MSEARLSKQRAWQLRRRAEGRCVICGRPAETKFHCREHADLHNALERARRRRKRGQR